MKGTLSYRPDIDGLRALAVGLVVWFHAFPDMLPGGYIGVDVFFVISGFLITSIIERSIREGSFTFADFYSRRVRRIFPALAIVLAACLVYGWLDLMQVELVHLGRHVAGGAAFISNWILHKESVASGGYFDKAAELKPLLHLWSLGIEEQFYIIWPPLLILVIKLGLSPFRTALIFGGISFVINLLFVGRFPEATFYLPMTRLWEMLAGCALATVGLSSPVKSSVRSISALVGITLILGAALSFDQSSIFPGWRAAIPVLGACLLIWAGQDAWPNKKVLSLPALVLIGLISYPLYLWHWPILYFMRLDSNFGSLERGGAVLIALILSWFTYAVVEKKIRHAHRILGVPAVSGLILIVTLLAIAGRIIVRAQPEGLLYKVASESQDLSTLVLDRRIKGQVIGRCGVSDETARKALWCYSDTRGTDGVVFGDSRAHALFPGLNRLGSVGSYWSLLSKPSCGPFLEHHDQSDFSEQDQADCLALNSGFVRDLGSVSPFKTVVLSYAARVLAGTGRDLNRDAMDRLGENQVVLNSVVRLISEIQAKGSQVVFIVDNPTLVDPELCVRRLWPRVFGQPAGPCGRPRVDVDRDYFGYLQFLAKLKTLTSDVIFYDPSERLCEDGFCSMLKDGKFLYVDKDHFSDYGSEFVAEELLKVIP